MFSLNSLNSVTKIFVVTVKGFEPATSCVRDDNATTEPARHMWETGSPNWLFHASVTYLIHWMHRISIPFRENSIVSLWRNALSVSSAINMSHTDHSFIHASPWRNIKWFGHLRFFKSFWFQWKSMKCQRFSPQNNLNDTTQFREDLMEIYI